MDPVSRAAASFRAPPGRRTIRRRTLLGAGGLLLVGAVTGCGLDVSDLRWEDEPAPTPTPGPDELARRRAVESARGLLDRSTAAAQVRPEAAPVLAEVARTHTQHLVALGAVPPPTGAASAPAGPPQATPVPTAGTDQVGDLVAQHTAAASQAMTDTAATSGPLARLLAQVAAARAVAARRVAAALGQAVPEVPAPVPAATPPAPLPPSAASATGSGSTGSGSTGSGPTASSSPHPAPSIPRATEQALLALLDGEHAAVYGYEALAVRLVDAQRLQALEALDAHRSVVDRLQEVLRAGGAPVPAAAPAYRLPGPVVDAPQASALAARLESSLAALAADLVAVSEGKLRALAVDLVLHRALAVFEWGAEPVALPGS